MSYFILINKDISIIWKAEFGRETERSPTHWFTTQSCDSLGWARPNLGARNCILVSHVEAEVWHLGHFPVLSQNVSREFDEK